MMQIEDVDDSEFIIGGLVYLQKAYIKELPTGWKPRCQTYEECKKGKTMDSAKKSVEKILEIAKKHGYTCVVGLRKEFDAGHPIDMYSGITGYQGDVNALIHHSIHPVWNHYKDGVKDEE